jgi:hypothetical protein
LTDGKSPLRDCDDAVMTEWRGTSSVAQPDRRPAESRDYDRRLARVSQV